MYRNRVMLKYVMIITMSALQNMDGHIYPRGFEIEYVTFLPYFCKRVIRYYPLINGNYILSYTSSLNSISWPMKCKMVRSAYNFREWNIPVRSIYYPNYTGTSGYNVCAYNFLLFLTFYYILSYKCIRCSI